MHGKGNLLNLSGRILILIVLCRSVSSFVFHNKELIDKRIFNGSKEEGNAVSIQQ